MMTQIHEVITQLEYLAPPAYQEGYDNAGLIVGARETAVTGVLISLDSTEDIIEEAILKNCNLVIAHHPIVFKGLKKLSGNSYVERTLIKAIRNNVAIYAIHTNLDHVKNGVNAMIASRLGLTNVKILDPKKELLMKLVTYIPVPDTARVMDALYTQGAGTIGNYSCCSFRSTGTGTFKPESNAQPVIGQPGQLEEVTENRVEIMFPAYMERKIIQTLRHHHPYEEVAYYLQSIGNENQEVGAGAIGNLPSPLPVTDFLTFLKEKMNTSVVRHTAPVGASVSKVAICGGAGSFLLPKAIAAGADVFVTADYKYHEFFDADQKIMICDIGHYESEVNTKDLLFNYLSEKFDNFALYLAETNTNPIRYFY